MRLTLWTIYRPEYYPAIANAGFDTLSMSGVNKELFDAMEKAGLKAIIKPPNEFRKEDYSSKIGKSVKEVISEYINRPLVAAWDFDEWIGALIQYEKYSSKQAEERFRTVVGYIRELDKSNKPIQATEWDVKYLEIIGKYIDIPSIDNYPIKESDITLEEQLKRVSKKFNPEVDSLAIYVSKINKDAGVVLQGFGFPPKQSQWLEYADKSNGTEPNKEILKLMGLYAIASGAVSIGIWGFHKNASKKLREEILEVGSVLNSYRYFVDLPKWNKALPFNIKGKAKYLAKWDSKEKKFIIFLLNASNENLRILIGKKEEPLKPLEGKLVDIMRGDIESIVSYKNGKIDTNQAVINYPLCWIRGLESLPDEEISMKLFQTAYENLKSWNFRTVRAA
ncbi:MAG: hypothetical protein KGZ97_03520 [Bacteroidetes bacterium]|nr:hypothetical protein [Bacteroidota bacterium]